MLTTLEKEFLLSLVRREKKEFSETKKSLFIDMNPDFLKVEHEFQDFLDMLEKKLNE